MCDWITEKSENLDMDDLAKNLTTVKALQRKHKGIERGREEGRVEGVAGERGLAEAGEGFAAVQQGV